MRYPFTHRTKRIVFLFVLLPTAAVAYMTLPKGDVRLPAEHARARTQDITIAANAPLVPRGRFLDPPPAYVSQSAAVRSPADEAAIEELALSAAATPLDSSARVSTTYAPNASPAIDVGESPARESDRSRRSSGGSHPYPQVLARGMEAAALGGSGSAKSAAGTGTTTTQATATTDVSPVTTTAAALAIATNSTAIATSTTPATTTRAASNAGGSTPPGPAAPPAVAAGGQDAIANTEDTPASATVAHVFSGAGAPGASGNAGQGGPPAIAQGGPVTQSSSPTSQSPSSTPEPLTLFLTASGLACVYGARRYIL